MGTPQDRIHARFKTDLAVTMKWRRSVVTVRAIDASDGGVFVRTDEQPNLRELVRLELTLPGRAEVFSVHGMPVNSAVAGDPEGREPGVGVQFYAMDRESQRVWGQYIEQLRRTQSPLPKVALVAPRSAPVLPEAPVPSASQAKTPLPAVVQPIAKAPVVAAPAPAVEEPADDEDFDDEALDAEPASGASLELEIASEEDLYEFYMRDIAAGGMFILSDVALPEGERLTLFIRHPQVDDTFELEAVVRSASEGPEGPGLEVEFLGLDEQRLDALRDFIECDVEGATGLDDLDATGSAEALTLDVPPIAAWQSPQDPQQGKLAQLFDPWTGSVPERPWSKPPPEDEFDSLFDALASGATGVRHSVPAPANEDVPDFLLAIPSFSNTDNPLLDPSMPRSIELEPDDLVEVRDERLRGALRATEEAARVPRRPIPRAR
jgi:Tfp pilus assembly protein PilZ